MQFKLFKLPIFIFVLHYEKKNQYYQHNEGNWRIKFNLLL